MSTNSKMTQVDFAKKLTISKQHLCDLDHDRKSVSPKLAEKYAEKLGYSQKQFIRLSLQDMVDREGLNATIEVNPKQGRQTGDDEDFAYA